MKNIDEKILQYWINILKKIEIQTVESAKPVLLMIQDMETIITMPNESCEQKNEQ